MKNVMRVDLFLIRFARSRSLKAAVAGEQLNNVRLLSIDCPYVYFFQVKMVCGSILVSVLCGFCLSVQSEPLEKLNKNDGGGRTLRSIRGSSNKNSEMGM